MFRKYGNTPLHYAVIGGHDEAVKYLLAKNAKVIANKERKTPQQLAVDNQLLHIAQLFGATTTTSSSAV